jgi:hypothetical protein
MKLRELLKRIRSRAGQDEDKRSRPSMTKGRGIER